MFLYPAARSSRFGPSQLGAHCQYLFCLMTPARSPDLFLPTWTTVSENLADLQEYLHADASDAGLISYMHLSQLGFIVG